MGFLFNFNNILIYMLYNNYLLLSEAEYNLKNYGDQGGPQQITPSQISKIQNSFLFKNNLKHSYIDQCQSLSSIACFSKSSGADKEMFSSADVLQRADVICRVVFLLFF